MPDTQNWGIFSCFIAFLLTKKIKGKWLGGKAIFSEKDIKNARLATLLFEKGPIS